MRMVQINTRTCDIFGLCFYVDAFSTVHNNRICMRFRFDPLSRAFSNRRVFNENAKRIGVDGRPKRIEMCAFLNFNFLLNGQTR